MVPRLSKCISRRLQGVEKLSEISLKAPTWGNPQHATHPRWTPASLCAVVYSRSRHRPRKERNSALQSPVTRRFFPGTRWVRTRAHRGEPGISRANIIYEYAEPAGSNVHGGDHNLGWKMVPHPWGVGRERENRARRPRRTKDEAGTKAAATDISTLACLARRKHLSPAVYVLQP